jgi:hypothetical protein
MSRYFHRENEGKLENLRNTGRSLGLDEFYASRMLLAPPYPTVMSFYYTFITPKPGFSMFTIFMLFMKFNWKVRKFIRTNSNISRKSSSLNLTAVGDG